MGGSNCKNDSKSKSIEKPKIVVRKFVTLGLANAGKTSLLYRLRHGELPSGFLTTIGIDFQILYKYGIKLQAWDFASRERTRVVSKSFYRGASGMIYMIDSADTDDIDKSLGFLNTVLEDEDITNLTLMVVANKQDLNNAMGPEEIEEKIKNKCRVLQGTTLFVMPMSVTAEDDHSVQLAYSLFVKTMLRKEKGKVQSGLIPRAWETAENEVEDSDIDDDCDDETEVADEIDVVKAKEKEANLAFIIDGKKKSFFKDPVHIFKSILTH